MARVDASLSRNFKFSGFRFVLTVKLDENLWSSDVTLRSRSFKVSGFCFVLIVTWDETRWSCDVKLCSWSLFRSTISLDRDKRLEVDVDDDDGRREE